ncbi:MAG: histidinol dehydrogenase [Chloroflexi bacterium]|nr:histidinol dehydrogenase [Chloroflexota bacterium]MCL5948974.1 histidinol dehydrogenase [Candidatus Bathyarchaeota archaeon]
MREGFTVKVWNSKELPANWFKRQQTDQKATQELENNVKAIINQVKANGDGALVEFALKFDKAELNLRGLKVKAGEIKEAYTKTSPQQVSALKFMKEKVNAFQKQMLTQTDIKTTNDGISIQTVLRPIESVGCYVPGGQAAYPSTLVMTAVPAKVAGVPRIVVCSPSDAKGKVNPLVLVAADICGVDEIYRVGGAQAIAALAYGTKTIAPVRKIVGPGSKYVTAAKVLVSTEIAIDMPAGPSEVLILADESADARLIAFDMVSQAEHGGDSVAGLITTSEKVSLQVQENLAKVAASAERAEKVSESLAKFGFIIVCRSMDEAVCLVNQFAAEHLEVLTAKPKEIADQLIAGLILLGPYSPVALSDYGSGTNHVLPTGGFAQAFSGLSALDFMRRVSIVESSKTGLERVKDSIKVLTEAENLPNHYKAIKARFEK